MLGMNVGTTVALCVAAAFLVSLLLAANIMVKMTRKRREFRRRGLS